MTSGRAVSKIDRTGLALFVLLIAWVGLSALSSGRSPLDPLLTILLCGIAFALGRAATHFLAPWVVPAAVVVLGYAIFIESPVGTLSNLSARGFLGYTNAKAAFFVQAAFAAGIIVAARRTPLVAALFLPAVALFYAVPVHARSLGAFVASTLLVPGLFVALAGRGRRAAVALAAVVALGAIATSVLLAREFADDRDSARESRLADRLDRGRVEVWVDAYRMLREHPGLGVGPAAFGDQSATASRERDLRWAHNEFLQLGAETGIIGLVLLIALHGWAFWKLWNAGTAAAAVAALGLSALVIQACADYLYHFPLLPATAAALVGSTSTANGASAVTPGPRSRVSDASEVRS